MSLNNFTVLWNLCYMFQQQIKWFYTNHRTVQKEEEGPPVAVGKAWTTWLVAAHFHKKEIDETLEKEFGDLAPNQRIAKWANILTGIMSELDSVTLNRYSVLAENWKKEGPPREIQRA